MERRPVPVEQNGLSYSNVRDLAASRLWHVMYDRATTRTTDCRIY